MTKSRAAIRRPLAVLLAGALAAAVALLVAGGGSSFGWLRPLAAPASWRVARAATGATLVAPPAWTPIHSDAGAVSFAVTAPQGLIAGYLNATPRSGGETLGNWRRFRIGHVADEGAHSVALEASATGLRFTGGTGSCVIDSYSTVRTRYREIACIVAGANATTVVVGAAPVARWSAERPLLERAIESFRVR